MTSIKHLSGASEKHSLPSILKHSRYTLLQRQTYDLSNDFQTISTLLGEKKINYKKHVSFVTKILLQNTKRTSQNSLSFLQ